MTDEQAAQAASLCNDAVVELHAEAVEMTARAQKFLDALASGKAPANPADVPKAHAIMRTCGPIARNPLAMVPVVIRNGMVDLEVGEG